MGIFDKLFGKKQTQKSTENQTIQVKKGDTFISTNQNSASKVIRQLTDEQKALINKSTLLLRTGQLYMHYWSDNLICKDRNDPEWQNKVMFFWKAEEPFPKKSLPPEFENLKKKHFLFQGDLSKISLQTAQAMPWFGMPGLGAKHVCELNNQKITIPELNELGLIEYIEPVEITNDNLDILTKKEEYLLLIDERITPFRNGDFLLNEKPIPIEAAYSIGGIHIVEKSTLDDTK